MLNISYNILIKIEELRDEEEVKSYFKDKGINLTNKELIKLKEHFNSLESEGKNLTHQQLNEVAGGGPGEVKISTMRKNIEHPNAGPAHNYLPVGQIILHSSSIPEHEHLVHPNQDARQMEDETAVAEHNSPSEVRQGVIIQHPGDPSNLDSIKARSTQTSEMPNSSFFEQDGPPRGNVFDGSTTYESTIDMTEQNSKTYLEEYQRQDPSIQGYHQEDGVCTAEVPVTEVDRPTNSGTTEDRVPPSREEQTDHDVLTGQSSYGDQYHFWDSSTVFGGPPEVGEQTDHDVLTSQLSYGDQYHFWGSPPVFGRPPEVGEQSGYDVLTGQSLYIDQDNPCSPLPVLGDHNEEENPNTYVFTDQSVPENQRNSWSSIHVFSEHPEVEESPVYIEQPNKHQKTGVSTDSSICDSLSKGELPYPHNSPSAVLEPTCEFNLNGEGPALPTEPLTRSAETAASPFTGTEQSNPKPEIPEVTGAEDMVDDEAVAPEVEPFDTATAISFSEFLEGHVKNIEDAKSFNRVISAKFVDPKTKEPIVDPKTGVPKLDLDMGEQITITYYGIEFTFKYKGWIYNQYIGANRYFKVTWEKEGKEETRTIRIRIPKDQIANVITKCRGNKIALPAKSTAKAGAEKHSGCNMRPNKRQKIDASTDFSTRDSSPTGELPRPHNSPSAVLEPTCEFNLNGGGPALPTEPSTRSAEAATLPFAKFTETKQSNPQSEVPKVAAPEIGSIVDTKAILFSEFLKELKELFNVKNIKDARSFNKAIIAKLIDPKTKEPIVDPKTGVPKLDLNIGEEITINYYGTEFTFVYNGWVREHDHNCYRQFTVTWEKEGRKETRTIRKVIPANQRTNVIQRLDNIVGGIFEEEKEALKNPVARAFNDAISAHLNIGDKISIERLPDCTFEYNGLVRYGDHDRRQFTVTWEKEGKKETRTIYLSKSRKNTASVEDTAKAVAEDMEDDEYEE